MANQSHFPAEDTKFENQLVDHHTQLLENFMKNETDFTSQQRRRVLKLYATRINNTNIRYFLMRPISVFLTALVTDKLEQIKNYWHGEELLTDDLLED